MTGQMRHFFLWRGHENGATRVALLAGLALTLTLAPANRSRPSPGSAPQAVQSLLVQSTEMEAAAAAVASVGGVVTHELG
ncbi:MAG: hypothetical protein ACE5EG_11745, partial [Thermoanaerobaculia bacterium]